MKQYRVVKNFNESHAGDVIWLNDRRAVSELRNGNIVELKEEKKPYVTKEEKKISKTKASSKTNKK